MVENAANQIYKQFFALTGHLTLEDKYKVADILNQRFERLSMELAESLEELSTD